MARPQSAAARTCGMSSFGTGGRKRTLSRPIASAWRIKLGFSLPSPSRTNTTGPSPCTSLAASKTTPRSFDKPCAPAYRTMNRPSVEKPLEPLGQSDQDRRTQDAGSNGERRPQITYFEDQRDAPEPGDGPGRSHLKQRRGGPPNEIDVAQAQPGRQRSGGEPQEPNRSPEKTALSACERPPPNDLQAGGDGF